MQHRKDIAIVFTTFLNFEESQAVSWITEPRLRRNLQRVLDQQALDPQVLDLQSLGPQPPGKSVPKTAQPVSISMLAHYWYQTYRPIATDLPRLHLFAYVQESCYWAAYRLHQRLVNSTTTPLYLVSDCFQIAIAEFPKILLKFNPDRGASLSTYAEVAFSGVIRDTLKQRREAEICSDWSLVRKISKKRLIESLENHGLSALQIRHYGLAWMCFRELWVPDSPSPRSSDPPADIWIAVAAAYQQLKALDDPAVSPVQVEQWLLQSGKILRAYLYPQSSSLNEDIPGAEGLEKLRSLASQQESCLGNLIAEEELRLRQAQYIQLQQVLDQALQTLKPTWRMALQLYYQQSQTQTQIARQMSCSQPSIVRYLVKGREALLAALVVWAKTELNNGPNPDRIGEQSDSLEEWLQVHYGRLGRSPQVRLPHLSPLDDPVAFGLSAAESRVLGDSSGDNL
jgi:RNA polymerase sigma factor (sigma-70 family)